MKVNFNKERCLLYGIGACALALAAGVFSTANKAVNKDAEYLKENAPEKYEYLKEKYGVEPFRGSAEHWATVAQMHRDSVENAQKAKNEEALKIDSIAQTNYIKGMQAVRDSLVK